LTDALPATDSRLIIGFEHADDAGVVRMSDEIALVQTVDFFTPVVDDPYVFGTIAAANALSDVFAMGGRPLSALNIVCFPSKALSPEVLGDIMRGGHDKLLEAGGVLAGGHTVRDKELKYGMAVTGLIHPDRIWANRGARPGDALVLTKAIGTGVLTTAFKRDAIGAAVLEPAIASMAQLNQKAMEAGLNFEIHSATDITGNGLAGHAWEIARASGVSLHFSWDAMPLLPGAHEAASGGFVPGGARSNGRYLGSGLHLSGVTEVARDLVLDPQTSGGLLFALPADQAEDLMAQLHQSGVLGVQVGEVGNESAGVWVGP